MPKDGKNKIQDFKEEATSSASLRSALNAENPNSGHRERLRDRFVQGGVKAVADYEMMELILFRSIPRRDTKPIAKKLMQEFGSVGEALCAPGKELLRIPGLGHATVADFKIVRAAADHILAKPERGRETLSSWSQVMDYCQRSMASMKFEDKEHLRVLFLDKKNQLIKDEILQTGTVDHTPVYPREVVRRALDLASTAIILVHNHPSGDPTPSRADIEMTKTIAEIAGSLGITIHDHIILGRSGHASLKALKLF